MLTLVGKLCKIVSHCLISGVKVNILVLGSGAREHAFAASLARSPGVHKIIACPGNYGISKVNLCSLLPFEDNSELVKYCRERVDLAVVGSSRFIEEGTVDALAQAGIPVAGPAADAGRIETSKAYSAEFIARNEIPSPVTFVAVNIDEVDQILKFNNNIRVVKCDGFARGAGVAVLENLEQVRKTAQGFLKSNKAPLILQEKIQGQECSYSILTDGNQWISFSSCRDYKRALDGDKGPTTGGMGAVCPSPDLTEELEDIIVETIVKPTVQSMKNEKLVYRGFLSFQLMLTPTGPKVLEFNARLGDPEAQTILARFRGDLASLLMDCARGRLSSIGSEVAFGKNKSASVVLARKGYPQSDNCLPVVENIVNDEKSSIFYSDCRMNLRKNSLIFKAGRLLTVTSVGENAREASKNSYNLLEQFQLQNTRYRQDIGQ